MSDLAPMTVSNEPLAGNLTSSFIRWVPSLSKGKVELAVSTMTDGHVELWDKQIQPAIDGLQRTDSGWRWPRIFSLTKFAIGQRPSAFAVCVTSSTGEEVPCALVQLVGKYAAADDRAKHGVFLWYFANAPVEALQRLLPPDKVPKMLGTVSLDVAVTHSFKERLEGRTSLHADPKGGDSLFKWYTSRGMTNLPQTAPKLSLFRNNDGRYFYYTPEAALIASRGLDTFRMIGE
jgi:hypothetical protein